MSRRQHRALRRLSKLLEGRFALKAAFPEGTEVTGISFMGEAGQPLRIQVDLVVNEPITVERRVGDNVNTLAFGPTL
jgi:hypothetical protein